MIKPTLRTLTFIGLFIVLLNHVAIAKEKPILSNKKDIEIEKIKIWSAIPTPFLKSGQIDEEGIRKNVRYFIDLKLDGVFCNGLMGETWSLTVQERKRILEVLIDESKGKLGISVVISANTTRNT